MIPKKPHKSLVIDISKKIKDVFPNSDLSMTELEDISQTISYLLIEAKSKLDQEARKHKYQRNLQGIKRHLNKASEYMQNFKPSKDQDIEYLASNEIKDIGVTFDDWVYVQGIINRLEEAGKLSTNKAHKQKIYSELFYYIHSVLTGIETDIKLGWSGSGQFIKFEKILHLLLKIIEVRVVSDKENKKSDEDIPEETIKTYIKLAKKEYDRHKKNRL